MVGLMFIKFHDEQNCLRPQPGEGEPLLIFQRWLRSCSNVPPSTSQGPQPLLWYNTVGEPDYPPLSLPCQSKVLWAGKIYRINSKKVNLWHSALKKYFLLNEQEYKITSGYYSKEIFLSLHKNICSERQEISWGRSRSTHSDPHPLPIQSVEGWAPC